MTFNSVTQGGEESARATADAPRHAVQFYETDAFLARDVGRYASEGFSQGEAVLIVATPAHRAAFERYFVAHGVNTAALLDRRQLRLLDAATTLSAISTAGAPDREKFMGVIGGEIRAARGRFGRVRAYGEMVDLTWDAGDLEATLALETLWDALIARERFPLLCGYRMARFSDAAHDDAFHHVCCAHTHVAPASDYDIARLDDPAALRRAVGALKQQARALKREIAERKEAERALSLTLQQLTGERARLETILRQMPAGVVILDVETEDVVLANDQLAQLFGRPFALSGAGAIEGLREDGTPYRREAWPPLRALRSGEVVNGEEIHCRRPDGTDAVIAVSAAPIHDREGRRLASIATFQDVTEQRQAQAERIKMSKLESIGLLAAGIAHDFNNILTAILGNVSLSKLVNGSADALEALGQAEGAAVRARDLTQQLLTFSKGGAPIKKLASVADFLHEATALALRGSNARLVLEVESDLAPAVFDAGQMSQVISNLLINAVQAMPDGGVIGVGARNVRLNSPNPYQLSAGPYVELSVRDEGVGIPVQHLARVFDPYFTTKSGGSGLGLATSYAIVKRHDGHIRVSSGPDGTTFVILLPASVDATTPSTLSAPGVRRGSGRLLLMDDEPAVCAVSAALLTQLGYSVTTVPDGETALARYAEALQNGGRFDLVILDLTVPAAMGGKECIERLRALDPAVKALVSSGYSKDAVMGDCARHAFAGVVAKPYRLEELSEAVYRALASRARDDVEPYECVPPG